MRLGRTRAVPLWGLRSRAKVRVDGDEIDVQLGDPEDADVVGGFVAGAVDLPRLDFARRLWSGRTAEFLGALALGRTLDAYRLDVGVRGLGFRRRTERAFRSLSPAERRRAEAWATGVNGWIDQTDVAQAAVYKRLGSRPRLVGAADALLLHRAPREVDGTHPADTDGWPERVRELWDALSGSILRGAGAVGELPSARHLPEFAELPAPSLPPRLTERTVLDRDDRHLFLHDGEPRRLYVARPDVAVKATVRRPWIRRTPEGWLVSDALQDAEGPTPPVGPAQVFEWPRPAEAPPPRVPVPPLGDHPWRIHRPEPRALRVELVPKRG